MTISPFRLAASRLWYPPNQKGIIYGVAQSVETYSIPLTLTLSY